jgi:hypothetical protein
MYRIRFKLLGLASFLVALLLSLFTPGTWMNRSIAVAMCGTIGICSPGTVANILQGDRAVAADVPVLVAQRSSEFDDEPMNLSEDGSQSIPSYPSQVSPNVPLRPDFRDVDIQKDIKKLTQQINIPNDFYFVEQFQITSETRATSFKSQSTSAEQIIIRSRKTGIRGIEFKNVSTPDNMKLNSFKIIFNNSNVSKIIFGDGTSLVLDDIRKMLPGKIKADIKINEKKSRCSLSKNEKSTRFDISNLISRTMAECEKDREDDYKIAARGLKAAASVITGSLTGIAVAGVVTPVGGVIVGAAVATATGVYLETIDLKGAPIYNAETKSICEAEAECGSAWSGGSGTYPTRFFSIKPGQKSRIIVSYEFYDVPDTIQVRRGTKVLWSRSGSGKGSEEFNRIHMMFPKLVSWMNIKILLLLLIL